MCVKKGKDSRPNVLHPIWAFCTPDSPSCRYAWTISALTKTFFFLSTAHWILFVCISELRRSCIVKTLLCSSLILHGPYTEYLNPNVTPVAKDTHIQLFTPPKLPDISFVEASETFFSEVSRPLTFKYHVFKPNKKKNCDRKYTLKTEIVFFFGVKCNLM